MDTLATKKEHRSGMEDVDHNVIFLPTDVLRRISMKHTDLYALDMQPWRDCRERDDFLDLSRRCRNPDALFIEDLQMYIRNTVHYAWGLSMLSRNAQTGHLKSMYIFNLIVLSRSMDFSGTLEWDQAIAYFRRIRCSGKVMDYRRGMERIVQGLRWRMQDNAIPVPHVRLCDLVLCLNAWRMREGRCVFQDDEDDELDPAMCERCRWDWEIQEFYRWLNIW